MGDFYFRWFQKVNLNVHYVLSSRSLSLIFSNQTRKWLGYNFTNAKLNNFNWKYPIFLMVDREKNVKNIFCSLGVGDADLHNMMHRIKKV